jgi:putative spermidine/putrescine transport system permease protein
MTGHTEHASIDVALDDADRSEQRMLLLLFAPALVFVSLFLVLPVLVLAYQSFFENGHLSFANYARIAQEAIYWRTFLKTFEIGVLITLASIVLAFPVAYLAARSSPGWAGLILSLVMLPFWTSVLVRSYAWLVVLQRTGIVNTALVWSGLSAEPLQLSHNYFATFVGMLHVMLPFMIFPLYASISKIPPELLQAGASLGGGTSYVFRRVVLPLVAPGILAGSVLVFILCLGFYLTPELLGGGKVILVSMLVQRNVDLYQQFGAASAVGIVLLILVLAIFWIVDRFLPVEKILASS